MKFCWCTLRVKNMEESIEFYKEVVELPLQRRFESRPGVEVAFLGEGETSVELVWKEEEKEFPFSDQISLGFIVSSLENKMETLETKGIRLYQEVVQPNPAIRFFYLKDPNGISIQFVEQIKV